MRGSSACTPSPPGLPGARQSRGFSCCSLASALLLFRMRSCGTGPFTAESHVVRGQRPRSLHAHFMAVLWVLPDRFVAGRTAVGRRPPLCRRSWEGPHLASALFRMFLLLRRQEGWRLGTRGAQRLRGDGQGRPQDRVAGHVRRRPRRGRQERRGAPCGAEQSRDSRGAGHDGKSRRPGGPRDP